MIKLSVAAATPRSQPLSYEVSTTSAFADLYERITGYTARATEGPETQDAGGVGPRPKLEREVTGSLIPGRRERGPLAICVPGPPNFGAPEPPEAFADIAPETAHAGSRIVFSSVTGE